jgi:hypothetical protein
MNTPATKLTVYKAIQKSFIAWGLKNEDDIRIYYRWQLKKRTKKLTYPCIIVDYDSKKREWYINHISLDDEMSSCTIDDITGQYSINMN